MLNSCNTERPIKRALISVADKIGLVKFVSQLVSRDIEIIATNGTAELLKRHQLPVTKVSAYTGFPEIIEGRVKTFHPKIYGGLLARPNVDKEIIEQHAIQPIDFLVVNLYPFIPTITTRGCALEKAVEQIDVGGASMLRAAAKNFSAVTVIIDPSDYSRILKEMQIHHGATTLSTRKHLAQKTFEHLSYYDAHIAVYLAEQRNSVLPTTFLPVFKKKMDLRYGENPHQAAALYDIISPLSQSLSEAQQLQGKPLSFNNLLDSDCAYRCVYEISTSYPVCVIVKHTTPTGAAKAESQLAAYEKAYATDPISTFGGIVAFNTPLESTTAKKIISQQFVEIIIAPDFLEETLHFLKAKPNLCLLKWNPFDHTKKSYSFHSISGGLLCQEADTAMFLGQPFTVVTRRQTTQQELQDLHFAWKIVKYVKSNAIVYAKNNSTLGIGSGQTSRVFAAKIAIIKAKEAGLSLIGAVMASDAFFPFDDSIEIAAEAGITAVIQPGGSKRDLDIIETADKAGVAMLFTHQRHFRH